MTNSIILHESRERNAGIKGKALVWRTESEFLRNSTVVSSTGSAVVHEETDAAQW